MQLPDIWGTEAGLSCCIKQPNYATAIVVRNILKVDHAAYVLHRAARPSMAPEDEVKLAYCKCENPTRCLIRNITTWGKATRLVQLLDDLRLGLFVLSIAHVEPLVELVGAGKHL